MTDLNDKATKMHKDLEESKKAMGVLDLSIQVRTRQSAL